jgi:hypothetical protein
LQQCLLLGDFAFELGDEGMKRDIYPVRRDRLENIPKIRGFLRRDKVCAKGKAWITIFINCYGI